MANKYAKDYVPPAEKQPKLKEHKIRPNIAEHDLQVKIKQMRGWLEDFHPVRVTLMLRGRENLHRDEALEILNKIEEAVKDLGKMDPNKKINGNNVIANIQAYKK